MISRQELEARQAHVAAMFATAGIHLKASEKSQIEIADFGLNDFEHIGLGLLVYVNSDRCCAKELALWPRQTCPEHRHPPVGSNPGKEETFRVRWGKMFLYVPGKKTASPKAKPPPGGAGAYTVWHEIELNAGDQYTLVPDTLHWFQAGDEGCVVSEFSTRSTDENDVFTDKAIQRATQIAG